MGDGINREIFVQDVEEKPREREGVPLQEWIPFTYIWPEFNGMLRDEYDMEFGDNDELFDEWGKVIAQTFGDFIRALGLNIIQFTGRRNGWKEKWEIKNTVIDAEDINMRSTMGVDVSTFLISAREADDVKREMDTVTPDQYTVLPYGTGSFRVGYEVCDVEIWLREHKDTFFNCLEQAATVYGYSVRKNIKVYKYSLHN